ncbi:hypothetical protein FOMG_01453 [Fusarium oxysporum f. sp. melonis 26406]|uniref:Uncharacterized protein n=1 Tax=Fusarium oxysporum f. sp. melonis 26406 TaxID=1089452 RepID=X0BUP9_FUSOX|nr:hypothetical protein FOMG_01453 [Fusarium oxysporum f. sp. melonis 26406]
MILLAIREQKIRDEYLRQASETIHLGFPMMWFAAFRPVLGLRHPEGELSRTGNVLADRDGQPRQEWEINMPVFHV